MAAKKTSKKVAAKKTAKTATAKKADLAKRLALHGVGLGTFRGRTVLVVEAGPRPPAKLMAEAREAMRKGEL